MSLIDISGSVYNGIRVISRDGRDTTGKTTWNCECHCGQMFSATGLNLKSGNTKSCGCLKDRPRFIDRTGEKFSRLKILNPVMDKKGRHTLWECECDCGNKTIVSNTHLFNGHTKSCGCLIIEASRENVKAMHKSGADHPRWKGGRRQHRSSAWARAVKEKDGACVKCGSEHQLHAHHITPVSECSDRSKDKSNGVTLCKACHIKFHSIYGYTGSTREDLFEYLGFDDPGDFSPWRVCCHKHSNIISLILDGSVESLEKAISLINIEIDALRAGRKDGADAAQDYGKAAWYATRAAQQARSATERAAEGALGTSGAEDTRQPVPGVYGAWQRNDYTRLRDELMPPDDGSDGDLFPRAWTPEKEDKP